MASHPIHDHLNEVPSQIENMDIESELDDEVDQLDSESDADVSELDMSMKNGTGSGGQRMPGHSLIPALRLENIIQADGKLYVSSTLYLVQVVFRCCWKPRCFQGGPIYPFNRHSERFISDCSALSNHKLKEEFIKRMAEAGHLQASSERRTSINYRDMGESQFYFLSFHFSFVYR